MQMYQLWAVRVDGGNGKELYGEDYADIYAINRLHFKAGSNKTCDHVSLCSFYVWVTFLASYAAGTGCAVPGSFKGVSTKEMFASSSSASLGLLLLPLATVDSVWHLLRLSPLPLACRFSSTHPDS